MSSRYGMAHLHKEILAEAKIAAAMDKISMMKWIEDAIQQKLIRTERAIKQLEEITKQ